MNIFGVGQKFKIIAHDERALYVRSLDNQVVKQSTELIERTLIVKEYYKDFEGFGFPYTPEDVILPPYICSCTASAYSLAATSTLDKIVCIDEENQSEWIGFTCLDKRYAFRSPGHVLFKNETEKLTGKLKGKQ